MATAFIGIGSNLGDRETHLRRALDLLAAEDGIAIVAVSELRETEPVGPVEQGPFLNGAVQVSTELTPRQLLERLLHPGRPRRHDPELLERAEPGQVLWP